MSVSSIKFEKLLSYAIQKVWARWKVSQKREGNGVNIGAYDGHNVGDMALKKSSKKIVKIYDKLHKELVKGDYNHNDLVGEKCVLYGGGATFTLEEAKKIAKSGVDPKKVVLLGVDVQGAKNKYGKKIRKFLRKTKWISVRQKRQKKILEDKIGRVKWHPDISFLMKDLFSNKCEKKVIGINVIPFMSMRRKLSWAKNYPWSNLSNKNNTALKREAKNKKEKYIELMRALVKKAISKGYEVRHHPFTPADFLFASSIFRDMEVEQYNYTPDVYENISRFEGYSKMIATRLHSHIFALMSEIPLISFAYSKKCYSLFEDMEGFQYKNQIGDLNVSKVDIDQIDIGGMWKSFPKFADKACKIVEKKMAKLNL